MNKQITEIQGLVSKLSTRLSRLRHYVLLIFITFIVLLYGFLTFKINTLSTQQPSNSDVSSQVQGARIPHIDQSVVDQLKSLQDNSVNVKALFDQTRSNPFQ